MAWLGTWKNRIKITIDYTKVSADLTQFPVMLYLSAASGIGSFDVSRVFDNLGANSLKLAITSDDELTELYVEVDKWDNANEQAWLHVSKSGWVVSSTVDTVLYLYYDADHADNSTYVGVVTSTPGKAVWDSYFKAVYHLSDNPDTSNIKDSTANANNGAKRGANEPLQDIAGNKIGDAQDFDGTDDYIGCGSGASLDQDDYTIEVILKGSETTGTAVRNVVELYIDNNNRIYFMHPGSGITNARLYGVVNGGGTNFNIVNVVDLLYHYYGISLEGTSWLANQDAVADVSTTGGDPVNLVGAPTLNIGGLNNGYFKGLEDELRISSTPRSRAWRVATYYNLFDNFVTFSVEATVTPIPKVSVAFSSDPLDDPLVYTMLTCAVKEIHCIRGRQHELDRMEAGTLTVVLDNTDGDFFPDNGGGAYSPNVTLLKGIKVQTLFNGHFYDTIECFVDSWELRWAGSGGTVPIAIISAVGGLKFFAQYALNDGAGYSAEASGTRVGNVADDVGWAASKRDIDAGQETLQATGALVNVNALEHLQLAQQSELSLLYEAATGDLAFEDRSHRTLAPHDTVQATFGDGVGELRFESITFALDDKLVANDVRLTRTGGTEQTASSSLIPVTYSLIRSGLLNNSDGALYLVAVFLAARYGNAVSRIKTMTINPVGDPSNLFPCTLGFDISTRIAVNLDQASVARECFIERIQHDWIASTGQFRTIWSLSDADQYFYALGEITETIRPNAAGDVNQLDSVGESGGYTCVDEVTSDEDTSYLWNGAASQDEYALFNCPSSIYGIGTIAEVIVYCRCRKTEASTLGIYTKIKTNGVEYASASQAVTGSYANYSKNYTVNPQTGLAWTWAEIAALQIGVRLVSDAPAFNNYTRCTQIWATVRFTPAW